jgi:hypothetical protein
MDQEVLVDRKIEDGGRLTWRLVADGLALTTAFWVKMVDEGFYRLYIALPLLPAGKIGEAYGRVYASLSKLSGMELTLSEIKLVGADDPLARAVLDIQRHYSARIAKWMRPGMLGGVDIEKLYIYAVPKPSGTGAQLPATVKVKLKSDVEQIFRPDEFLEPLTPQDVAVLGQIVSSGVAPPQAEYFVRKRRESARHRPPIPAGTIVNARIRAWWGDDPNEDPNPLLEVEAPDGAQGLTFKDNTEPVNH